MRENVDISVAIPIYKGKKYIASIIEMLEANQKELIQNERKEKIEVIFVNDYPNEKTVDDYREAVPRFNSRFDQLIEKLEEYNIKYYINKADSWIDLAPDTTDYSNLSEEELIHHRDSCSQSWEELRDGKIYSCNYAAYATVAGIAGEQDLEETYNLELFTSEKKKELIEFRIGYTEKGYTNFCKKCRGFTPENSVEVEPALQKALI